jgi:hypothetical protein
MHGVVSSLVLILALSTTVTIAAPKAAVSESRAANAVEEASVSSSTTVESASTGCLIHGTCSILSPPDYCCGFCLVVNSATVSQDTRHLRKFRLAFFFVGLLRASLGFLGLTSWLRKI